MEDYPNRAPLPLDPNTCYNPPVLFPLILTYTLWSFSVTILQMKNGSFKKTMNVSKITHLATEGARTPSQVSSTQHSPSASHTTPAGGPEQSRSWGGSFSRVVSQCTAQFCMCAVSSARHATGGGSDGPKSANIPAVNTLPRRL